MSDLPEVRVIVREKDASIGSYMAFFPDSIENNTIQILPFILRPSGGFIFDLHNTVDLDEYYNSKPLKSEDVGNKCIEALEQFYNSFSSVGDCKFISLKKLPKKAK